MGIKAIYFFGFSGDFMRIKFQYQLLILLGFMMSFNNLHSKELDQKNDSFVYDLKEAEKLATNETSDELTHKLLYADRLFHLRALDDKYRKDALESYQKILTLSKEKFPAVFYRLALLFDEVSDLKKSNFYFEEAKNLNNSAAIYKIATYYISGQHGYQKNPERGVSLLKKAAEDNNVEAMELLGMLYSNGILVPYDMERALFFGQKMYEEKIIQNYLSLSNLFSAKGWLEMTKNNASTQATQDEEAAFNQNPNFKTAFVYTQKAADLGSKKAAEQLANMYETGLGVEIDKEKAQLWREKAAGTDKTLPLVSSAKD